MEHISKYAEEAANAAKEARQCTQAVASNEEINALKRRFMEVAQRVCPGFEIAPADKPRVNEIFMWCIEHPDSKLDLNRGLWLWGNIGTGKSTMLKVIKEFCKAIDKRDSKGDLYGFRISDAIEISAEYQRGGYEAVQTYIDSNRQAFDEVGAETPTMHYGKEEDTMRYILQRRYDYRHRNFTHVTSNLALDQIADVYGSRVYDRCNEMFNFVHFEGYSKRPKGVAI